MVACATGSVVLDAQAGGSLGLAFVAFMPFAGVAAGVFFFGRVSMAHFNPAVTVGFLVTGHVSRRQVPYYLAAEVLGALIASFFVMHVVGTEANLGSNAPGSFALGLVFAVEMLATGLLLTVVLFVVRLGLHRVPASLCIGGIIGLDIFFFASISGASMNPARSLAPALLSGTLHDLWLYWSATFAGSVAVAAMFRKRFAAG